jgi:hypothetical protein
LELGRRVSVVVVRRRGGESGESNIVRFGGEIRKLLPDLKGKGRQARRRRRRRRRRRKDSTSVEVVVADARDFFVAEAGRGAKKLRFSSSASSPVFGDARIRVPEKDFVVAWTRRKALGSEKEQGLLRLA